MTIYYSSKFAREYRKLPNDIKKVAERRERLFRLNPFDPNLKGHKLKGVLTGFYSFSINQKCRIIFDFAGRDIIWFHSVGEHSIYNLWD